MKLKTLVIAAVMAVSVSASADEKDNTSGRKVCELAYLSAAAVMEGRLVGMSAPELFSPYKDTSPAIKSLTLLMIKDAFETPAYSSLEFQRRAISEFANRWFLLCMES